MGDGIVILLGVMTMAAGALWSFARRRHLVVRYSMGKAALICGGIFMVTTELTQRYLVIGLSLIVVLLMAQWRLTRRDRLMLMTRHARLSDVAAGISPGTAQQEIRKLEELYELSSGER